MHLASEEALGRDYSEFPLGAVPPLGGSRRDPVVVDSRLAERESVVLEAGSHDESIRISRADLVRLTGARVADVAQDEPARRVPLQKRVTPLGDLIASPARGLVYGNRGCLHDANGRIRRRYNGKRWIACRLEFKGWQRGPLMQPGRFTELFFLDEATAFAAGHRPCAPAAARTTSGCSRSAARWERTRSTRGSTPSASAHRSGCGSTSFPTGRSYSARGSRGSCSALGCSAGPPRATSSPGRDAETSRRS